jgi:hypothetical protein
VICRILKKESFFQPKKILGFRQGFLARKTVTFLSDLEENGKNIDGMLGKWRIF